MIVNGYWCSTFVQWFVIFLCTDWLQLCFFLKRNPLELSLHCMCVQPFHGVLWVNICSCWMPAFSSTHHWRLHLIHLQLCRLLFICGFVFSRRLCYFEWFCVAVWMFSFAICLLYFLWLSSLVRTSSVTVITVFFRQLFHKQRIPMVPCK